MAGLTCMQDSFVKDKNLKNKPRFLAGLSCMQDSFGKELHQQQHKLFGRWGKGKEMVWQEDNPFV